MDQFNPLLGRKLPIPPLPTTAYTVKTTKQRKTEKEKKAKKTELNRARDQTRVSIGVAFTRWRELRDLQGYKTDAELATFLLNRYKQASSSRPSSPAASSILPESVSDRCQSGTLGISAKPTRHRRNRWCG
ncbi:uncharacterized protein KZ484_024651 [Pholidichthys leucotaenia]